MKGVTIQFKNSNYETLCLNVSSSIKITTTLLFVITVSSLLKAMGLMLDRHIVRSHLCRNSSDMLVSAACSSGTLDTLLSWISPDKLAKQVHLTHVLTKRKPDRYWESNVIFLFLCFSEADSLHITAVQFAYSLLPDLHCNLHSHVACSQI